MTAEQQGFTERVRALIGAAGSQRRLAEIIGVRDGTIIGWLAGSVPYERTLRQIVERTGVALEWLADGRGDAAEEVETFRRRLTVDRLGASQSRVAETPDMECPFVATPGLGIERHIEQAAAQMDGEAIAAWITSILRDKGSPDRHRIALRLLPKLAERLTAEQKRTQARM